MATWELQSRDRTGTFLGAIPYRNLQGEWFRNKPDQIRFDIPLYSNDLTRSTFYPGKTEIWALRNGVKQFVGPLWDVTASSQDGVMSCSAEGLESYLQVRRINEDVYFTGRRDQTAWSLINTAQTGTDAALGITQGSINTTTPTHNIGWKRNDGIMVADAMDTLSGGAQGFDWEIDVNRAFNLYYPRPYVASRITLNYPGTILRYSVQIQGKFEANDILVTGDQDVISQPTIDTVKRAEYGLRQYNESNTDLTTQTQVNDYSQQVLRLRRDARETPSFVLDVNYVSPFDGDIWFGQTAPVVISDGWTQYNQTMRLNGFQCTVGKQGNESFNLYMSDLREVQ